MKISKSPLLHVTILLMIILACKPQNQGQEQIVIELNQGEKWEIIPEMMAHIRASENLFSKYIEESAEDFKKLAEGLKENNNKLIKSCKMKGKAHDELHKWLHPHLQMVESLSKANSQEQASKVIDKLKISFQTLNTYFK